MMILHTLRRGLTSSTRLLNRSSESNNHVAAKETLPMSEKQKRLYPQVEQEFSDEGYPILNLAPSKRTAFDKRPPKMRRISRWSRVQPRETKMEEDQDWPSIWPVAKTFVPSAVPLQLRQSYEAKASGVPRGKYANTELLKITNFLHLTPVAIERHCKALKKFCAKWPDGLKTDDEVRSHFPVTYVTRDYVHSSPTIRDERARIVDLMVRLEDLNLNDRDEDKLKRLANHRYDLKTGILTITTKSCPTKIQNQDYADYLLTALYFESKIHEKWEDDKPECDWERFFWDKSESKKKFKIYLKSSDDETIVKEEYKNSLEKLYNNESFDNLEAYRMSVERLLNLNESAVPQ